MYSETRTLTPAAPFELKHSLSFIGSFMPTDGEQSLQSQTLTKAVMIERHPVAFRIQSVGTVQQPSLSVAYFSEAPLTPSIVSRAETLVKRYLSLEDDLRPFYAAAEADSVFLPVARNLYGYHQVRFLTPFENAIWAVLTQRNPIPVARKMKDRIIEALGGTICVEGLHYPAFPEAKQLTPVELDQWVELIRNGRKAEYVAGVVRAFASVDEDWLYTAPYEEVLRWLLSIKGIGAWSANFILLRGIGRCDQIPEDEKMLGEIFDQLYGAEVKPADIARRYGSLQGYWAHYLRVAGRDLIRME